MKKTDFLTYHFIWTMLLGVPGENATPREIISDVNKFLKDERLTVGQAVKMAEEEFSYWQGKTDFDGINGI